MPDLLTITRVGAVYDPRLSDGGMTTIIADVGGGTGLGGGANLSKFRSSDAGSARVW